MYAIRKLDGGTLKAAKLRARAAGHSLDDLVVRVVTDIAADRFPFPLTDSDALACGPVSMRDDGPDPTH